MKGRMRDSSSRKGRDGTEGSGATLVKTMRMRQREAKPR